MINNGEYRQLKNHKNVKFTTVGRVIENEVVWIEMQMSDGAIDTEEESVLENISELVYNGIVTNNLNTGMYNSMATKIIIFEDGMYFNGVKGKRVRKTKHFKDAKIMDSISERDSRHLKDHAYKLVDVQYSMTVMED